MQLINLNTIDTALTIADTCQKGGKEIIELGRDFRPIFEQACIHSIAAGITTRRFYDAHLHQPLIIAGQLIAAIAALFWMVSSVMAAAAWGWVKDFVLSQYAGSDFFGARVQQDSRESPCEL